MGAIFFALRSGHISGVSPPYDSQLKDGGVSISVRGIDAKYFFVFLGRFDATKSKILCMSKQAVARKFHQKKSNRMGGRKKQKQSG